MKLWKNTSETRICAKISEHYNKNDETLSKIKNFTIFVNFGDKNAKWQSVNCRHYLK